MVKRQRNSIGQFISSDNEFKRTGAAFYRDKAKKKSIIILIAIILIILASPWIVLLLKSKKFKGNNFWLGKVFW